MENRRWFATINYFIFYLHYFISIIFFKILQMNQKYSILKYLLNTCHINSFLLYHISSILLCTVLHTQNRIHHPFITLMDNFHIFGSTSWRMTGWMSLKLKIVSMISILNYLKLWYSQVLLNIAGGSLSTFGIKILTNKKLLIMFKLFTNSLSIFLVL